MKSSTRDHLKAVLGNMKNRCYNKKNKAYKYYGGRGVSICERWLRRGQFIKDMLPTYFEGASLDRIDNGGPYSQENCRWVDHTTQCRNRRSCNYLTNPKTGESKTITEWALVFEISRNTITSRIRLGYKDFSVLTQKSVGRGRASFSREFLRDNEAA